MIDRAYDLLQQAYAAGRPRPYRWRVGLGWSDAVMAEVGERPTIPAIMFGYVVTEDRSLPVGGVELDDAGVARPSLPEPAPEEFVVLTRP